MKIVAQRVNTVTVSVDAKTISKIGKGLLLFLGVAANDTWTELEWLAKKIINLRIFEDENGKMNRSVLDIEGEILLISQFTLLANCQRGRRPDFLQAAPPYIAEELYLQFAEELKKLGIKPELGIFAADMKISLENDGPVTIVLEK